MFGIGVSYEGGDPELLDRLLPHIDYIEVTPDTIAVVEGGRARLKPSIIAELKSVGGSKAILAHGVGLSIGSHDGVSQRYVELLDELCSAVEVRWHSDHLAYTNVDGENLGTMLTLPRTDDVLDMIGERVSAIRQRFPMPFLLENVVHLLPEYPSTYSDAAFLNRLCATAGCGLILDLYNLECDARNWSTSVSGFLSELDLDNVMEVHLAGGVVHRGFQVDVHSRRTAASTIGLTRQVLSGRNRVRTVTFEFLREAIPSLGHDAIVEEVSSLRARVDHGPGDASTGPAAAPERAPVFGC